MSAVQEPVIKHCNVKAKGCLEKYDLTERARRELQDGQRKKYKSRYDACDNPACQVSMLGFWCE